MIPNVSLNNLKVSVRQYLGPESGLASYRPESYGTVIFSSRKRRE